MARDNIAEFSADLDKFAKRMNQDVVDLTRRVALEVLQEVTTETPVDTGRARGNWFVGLNRVSEEVDEAASDSSGSKTVARGRRRLSRLKPGVRVFISNNVKYIRRLNDGYSAQAGKFFVQSAVARVSARFR